MKAVNQIKQQLTVTGRGFQAASLDNFGSLSFDMDLGGMGMGSLGQSKAQQSSWTNGEMDNLAQMINDNDEVK